MIGGLGMMLKALGVDIDPDAIAQLITVTAPAMFARAEQKINDIDARMDLIEGLLMAVLELREGPEEARVIRADVVRMIEEKRADGRRQLIAVNG